jgi:hypothetical protein
MVIWCLQEPLVSTLGMRIAWVMSVLIRSSLFLAQGSVALAERGADATMTNPGGALSAASVMASLDDDDCSAEARNCVQALREGKRCACNIALAGMQSSFLVGISTFSLL